MYKLRKSFSISCSHRLHNDDLSEEENKSLFGKCNNLPSHGHNYTIILYLQKKELDKKTGMVRNFNEIKDVFKESIDDKFDHTFLNDSPEFEGIVPSAERMCKVFYDILKKYISELTEVEIYETATASASYVGDDKK